mmetsp:Transcript_26561/g.76765  ORF Transcript_26561/g.76765 Transcript_26561/m.76765 type:complete len:275 (-) Transcript_26561:634-1458(-)
MVQLAVEGHVVKGGLGDECVDDDRAQHQLLQVARLGRIGDPRKAHGDHALVVFGIELTAAAGDIPVDLLAAAGPFVPIAEAVWASRLAVKDQARHHRQHAAAAATPLRGREVDRVVETATRLVGVLGASLSTAIDDGQVVPARRRGRCRRRRDEPRVAGAAHVHCGEVAVIEIPAVLHVVVVVLAGVAVLVLDAAVRVLAARLGGGLARAAELVGYEVAGVEEAALVRIGAVIVARIAVHIRLRGAVADVDLGLLSKEHTLAQEPAASTAHGDG